MKALLPVLSLLFLLPSAAVFAADPASIVDNGDFSKGMEGWEVVMPDNAKAQTEIVPDGFEGKPCLKVTVNGHELEPWQGRASVTTHLEPGASYTVKVHLMSEPDESRLDIVAWARNEKDKSTTLLGERESLMTYQGWEEFEYHFTAGKTPFEKTGVSIGNLARPYQSIYIANMVVTKD